MCLSFSNNRYTGLSKKVPAKFSDTCSVRADGLCIGSPRLVGGRKAGNSNVQEFFCTTLYSVGLILLDLSFVELITEGDIGCIP